MINVGVVGTGRWGFNYVRVLSELEEANLKWCCDLNEKNLKKVKESFPNVRITKNLNDILNDSSINAVCVSTPAIKHFDIVKACLEAGKHVLVEKPLTTSLIESEELVEISRQNDKILMVGHIFLFNSAVRKLKELIDSGELGDIYYTYSQRTGLGPIRNDVNAMWDLAPHDISIFCYLLDTTPISVNAQGLGRLRNDIEDIVFMTLKFPKNILANIHVSWFAPKKVRKVVVVGSDKMAIFDDVEPKEKLKIVNANEPSGFYKTFKEFQNAVKYGDIVKPRLELMEPLKVEVQHFLNCIKSGKRPLTDGENGLQVVKVLEAADKSIHNNGEMIKI